MIQSFDITVKQLGRSAFAIGIAPVPVMKWHDVVNAREELRTIIRQTVGLVDRRSAIAQGAQRVVRAWGEKGIIFPNNWVDGDEYIPMHPPNG